MAKTRYAVSFTYTPTGSERDGGSLLLEQLRYAQLVRTEEQPDGSIHVLMFPPHGLDSQRWAKANSDRMHTFGYRDAAPVVY